jgi:hypothetical protein
MTIDWVAVTTVAAPIIALLIAEQLYSRRTRLISFYSHVAAITGTFPGATQQTQVNTHTVVLRNTGRQAASNVRLHHGILPLYSIYPVIVHHVDTLPDGSQDIAIPTLVPGEQITITYLYFPPTTYAQVNQGIKCDEGFAQAIPVNIRRVFPRWWNVIAQLLFLVGVGTVAYFIYRIGRCAVLSCGQP